MDRHPQLSTESTLLAMLFQQNSENARHIKSERIWFMNIYAMITAGVLSLLRGVHGNNLLEIALLVFMCVFSSIGLLTSFRLKAELEECLHKLQAMAEHFELSEFVALGQSEGALAHYPKFRWIFPIFYTIATAAFAGLLAYRLVTGKAAGW